MDSLITCHDCDLVHRIKTQPTEGAAHCIRCGAVLYKHKPNSLERSLAFALAGLVACRSCHLLCERGKQSADRLCPRCGAGLHERKPNSIARTWESLKVGADINVCLMTKLWETDSGVTLWTNSSSRRKSVARLKADTVGNIKFGASDPKDSCAKLVPELVYANTTDFRSSYEYRKVK